MVPHLDISEFPIVRITFGNTLTLEDLAEHKAATLRLFNERGPILFISNLDRTDTRDLLVKQRQQLAKDADELTKLGVFIAEFVVVRSPILRGMFTAYSWMRKNKAHPLQAFSSDASARAAALALIRPQARSA